MEKDKLKLSLKIAGGVILAYALFKGGKALLSNTKVRSKLGDFGVLKKDKKGNLEGLDTEVRFNAEIKAEKIKDAIVGWGTDVETIINVLKPLTKEQRRKVEEYFNVYLGDGETLKEWLDDEYLLSDEDKQKIKSYLS